MKKQAKQEEPQQEGQPIIPDPTTTASDNTSRPPLDKPIPGAKRTEEGSTGIDNTIQ